MRGSVRKVQKENGHAWKARIDLPTGDPAKRRQLTRHFNTKKEAEKWLAKKNHELYSGSYIEPTDRLLQDWLKEWLQTFAKPNIRETTYVTYKSYLRNHTIPALGHIALKDITPALIQEFYNSLDLAPASVRRVHMILRQALEKALVLGYIRDNPADGNKVSIPKASTQHKELQYWTPKRTHKFLHAAQNHSNSIYATLFYLAVMTGMRRGELLGLRWQDIDFNRSQISVRQSITYDMEGNQQINNPKTKHGERTISLDQETLTHLTEHKEYMSRLKEQLGDTFRKSTLVFTSTVGKDINVSNLRRAFNNIIEHAGIPKIRFHDLRYTHASLLLNSGVNPKIVQERLGHSSIQVTMDIYSHLMPNMQEEAINQFADTFYNNVKRELINSIA